MLISRWQASIAPSLEQIRNILQSEGLDSKVETFLKNQKMIEKKTPLWRSALCRRGRTFSKRGRHPAFTARRRSH